MKRIFVLVFIASFFVFGCAPANVDQPDSTEIVPQNVPTQEIINEETSPPTEAELSTEPAKPSDIISGDLTGFQALLEVFPGTYSLANHVDLSKEGLVETWGSEYQQILDQVEWMEGINDMYLPEPDLTDIPIRILVVIERFASTDGAAAFISYDFPSDFRKGVYNGEPIVLGAADNALLATIDNPFGDDPNARSVTITYQYKNIDVLVVEHGTAGTVTFEMLEPIALAVLENLEANH